MNITVTNIRYHKDIEAKVHEQLYNNIFYLTAAGYPTTKDFDEVFKKDMFVRNNKAAFHHVIYYLLNILNPQIIKEKITSWPIYEIRLENKFRNEVLKYINELSLMYENADIPTIMASHLISPGGFKFGKFMLKLSQLVLIEHLRKNEAIKKELLHHSKPNKNSTVTNKVINDLQLKTKHIERHTKEKYDEFQEYYQTAVKEANKIVAEQSEFNKNLGAIKLEHEASKRQFQEKYSIKSDYERKLKGFEDNIKSMENFNNFCCDCYNLITHLFNKDLILVHNKSNLSNENYHHHNGDLDLLQFLRQLIASLEQQNLELPNYNSFFLHNLLGKLSEINGKYSQLNKKFDYQQNELFEAMEQLQLNHSNQNGKETCDTIKENYSVSEEILAVPLEDSSGSDWESFTKN